MTESHETIIVTENEAFWDIHRQPAGCPHCKRVFLVEENKLGGLCPHCYQGSLESQPARLRSKQPERIMPFNIKRNQVQSEVDHFVSGVWIKPTDFQTKNLMERMAPIYWPMWLVDCDVDGHWQMEAGFDYQVESTKESFSGGQWQSKKQIENRIRWEPRLGQIQTHLDNIVTPALDDHKTRFQQTGTYRIEDAKPFDPQHLGSALIEVPDLPPDNAWPLAKPQAEKRAARLCAKAAGAGHARHFALKANYDGKNWTQLLLPMLTSYYLDDNGHPQVIILNGETGKISGPRLASQKKGFRMAGIIAAISGVLLMIALFSLILSSLVPVLRRVAAFMSILGIGVGITAIIPAIWPWQWNRQQAKPSRMRGDLET
jgi:hypothetical protein